MYALSYVLSRVVSYWKLALGVIVAALPVVAYVFGRKDGKKLEQNKAVQEVVKTEQARSDFYKDIAEATHEAQANRPTDRDDLVKRVREHGL